MHSRRLFLGGALATAAGCATRPGVTASAPPKLRKALKYGMIKAGQTPAEKFALARSVGFEGVEMPSPSKLDVAEVVKAREQTGMVIHGVVGDLHWKERHSDPDPAVRAKALANLQQEIRDCQAYGGSTVLVVPGKVGEHETFDEVWQRSQEEIRKAIPMAKDAGVKIAIEVVWNDFLTTPEMLVKYVDAFGDPTVGAYFDVSNMIKYGVPPATWIRQLGKRMFKFDFKGYSHEKKWVGIGEGDEDWPAVLAALAEVGYQGWATSEVKGGGEPELRDVFQRMTRVLGG
jgi:hexulose-6-phosphate isomerase